MNLYPLIRPLLFQFDPEDIHQLTLSCITWVGKHRLPKQVVSRLYQPKSQQPIELFGLTFPNQIGLAAGYDKDASGWPGLACLGFGHIEVGTITLQPQQGNPRPRIFRLPADRALINRMGFPGKGSRAALENIHSAKKPEGLILGINVGKNKDTPLEEAVRDYLQLMDMFFESADYLAVNISSPNTVGLRQLQNKQHLEGLLGALKVKQKELSKIHGKSTPLVVKLAPDLDDSQLDDALECITHSGIDGVILTNTTIQRPELKSTHAGESGGLSGSPLFSASTEMVHKVHQRICGRLPIIASGGVMTAADARQKLDAGASLVQVYSGLVYYGPALPRDIVNGLS